MESSSGLLSRGGRSVDLVEKLKGIYEDAKSALKNISCGRRDDVSRPAYDMLEQRSARPSEARRSGSTSSRLEVQSK